MLWTPISRAPVEPTGWADLLAKSPYIAMVLFLGLAVWLLYRSREKERKVRDELQKEYRETVVKATRALSDLASEYLRETFSEAAAWQDRFQGLEIKLKQHRDEQLSELVQIKTAIEGHEGRVREFVKDYVDRVADRQTERFERAVERDRS